jgi:hypothetical protein
LDSTQKALYNRKHLSFSIFEADAIANGKITIGSPPDRVFATPLGISDLIDLTYPRAKSENE